MDVLYLSTTKVTDLRSGLKFYRSFGETVVWVFGTESWYYPKKQSIRIRLVRVINGSTKGSEESISETTQRGEGRVEWKGRE